MTTNTTPQLTASAEAIAYIETLEKLAQAYRERIEPLLGYLDKDEAAQLRVRLAAVAGGVALEKYATAQYQEDSDELETQIGPVGMVALTYAGVESIERMAAASDAPEVPSGAVVENPPVEEPVDASLDVVSAVLAGAAPVTPDEATPEANIEAPTRKTYPNAAIDRIVELLTERGIMKTMPLRKILEDEGLWGDLTTAELVTAHNRRGGRQIEVVPGTVKRGTTYRFVQEDAVFSIDTQRTDEHTDTGVPVEDSGTSIEEVLASVDADQAMENNGVAKELATETREKSSDETTDEEIVLTVTNPVESSDRSEITHATERRATRSAESRRGGESRRLQQTTHNCLRIDHFVASNVVREYSSELSRLVNAMSDSPRKAPISIISVSRNEALYAEIRQMADLLPKGFIIIEGHGLSAMVRFGSGINIKRLR